MVYGFGATYTTATGKIILYNMRIIDPKDFNHRDVKVIDDSDDGGMHFYGRGVYSGRPVHIDKLPKMIRYSDPKPIPDFIEYSGVELLSTTFKEIIEKFEPDVHQFVPVKYVGGSKRLLVDMWVLVICNRIDSASRENTTTRFNHGWLYGTGNFVVDESKTRGLHMWRDSLTIVPTIWISDILAEALDASGLTGFSIGKAESV